MPDGVEENYEEEKQAIVFCLGLIEYGEGEPYAIEGVSHRFSKGFLQSSLQFVDERNRPSCSFPIKTAQINSKKEAKKLKQIILKEIDYIFDNLNDNINPNDLEDSLDFIIDSEDDR